MKTKSEKEFDFVLVLEGVEELTTEVENKLFAAGCDDATLSLAYGRLNLEFSRSATSLKHAILSAICDVRNANMGADVLQVDSCHLLTQAEIARRIGRSRQLVNQYILGQRGPGNFPAPVCHLHENTPLWHWCAVSQWLADNDMLRKEVVQEAEVIEAINCALETARQKGRNPSLFREVSAALKVEG
jgi:hypothetical protein